MLKLIAKRFMVLALILVMVLGYLPVSEWIDADGTRHPFGNAMLLEAQAAQITSGNGTWISGKLTYTYSVDSNGTSANGAAGTVSASGGTLTVTATNSKEVSGCSTTAAEATTTTVTVTNASSYPLKIDTLTSSTASVSGAAQGDVIAPGATFKITVTAPAKTNSTKVTGTVAIAVTEKNTVEITAAASSYVSYTLDGHEVAQNGESVTFEVNVNKVIALPSVTAPSGYEFKGWRVGSSITNDSSFTANGSFSVFPVIVSAGTDVNAANFKVGSNTYTFWEDAMTAAVAGGGKVIVNLAEVTLPTNVLDNLLPATGGTYVKPASGGVEYILPAGVTLQLPYDTTATLHTTTPAYGYKERVTPSAFRTLTVPNGVKITVNGSVSVDSYVCAYGQGSGGKNGNGTPSGPHGKIVMKSGSEMTFNSGANLYCYGYINGDGLIHMKSGAKVYELFQFCDWRGGTATSDMPDNSQRVFPMSQYYVQNVEAPMSLYKGATEYVWSVVNMRSSGYPTNQIEFIGTNGMFKLTGSASDYITKRYHANVDQLEIAAHGDMSLNALNVSISGLPLIGTISMQSKNYVLPLNNMNIVVETGTTSIASSQQYGVAFLPSSKLTVNEGATFTANAPVYLYDADDWGPYCYGSVKLWTSAYSTANGTTNIRTADNLKDAELDVNGTVTVSSKLYTTEHGANITSSNGTGVISFTTACATSTATTYQATQSGSDISYTAITVNNAWLKNGDESYSETVSTGTSKWYYDKDGEHWYRYLVDFNFNGSTIARDYYCENNDTLTYDASWLTNLGASVTSGSATAAVSGSNVVVTNVTVNSVVTLTGTPAEYKPTFVLSEEEYTKHYQFYMNGATLSNTVTINDATYYVVDQASSALAVGTAYAAPTDASMGVSAENHNSIVWNLSGLSYTSGDPYRGTVPAGETAGGPSYIYGFYDGVVAHNSWNDQYYKTLADAFNVLPQDVSATITLLADCGTFEEESGTVAFATYTANNITLDLNGHHALGRIVNAGTMILELNGGTLDYHTGATAAAAGYQGMAAIINSGTLTVQDSVGGGLIKADAISNSSTVSLYSAGIRNNAGAHLTMTGGTLQVPQAVNTYSAGIMNYADGVIDSIADTTITTQKGCAIYNLGTVTSVSGVNFSANGSAIYNAASCTLGTVSDSTLHSVTGYALNNYGNTGTVSNCEMTTLNTNVLYNYNGAKLTTLKDSNLTVTTPTTKNVFVLLNLGGTITTVDNCSLTGNSGIDNRNIKGDTYTAANGSTISKTATIGTISDCEVTVGQYALLNRAVINTISGSTFKATPASAQVGWASGTAALNGNVQCYTVYNSNTWWATDSLYKRADNGLTRTDTYLEDEQYRPRIGTITDCTIIAENTSTSADYGYALCNLGVINSITGETEIKTYAHPNNAKLTTSNYALLNNTGGVIKSIGSDVTVTASNRALQNSGQFTATKITVSTGTSDKPTTYGGQTVSEEYFYGSPSKINAINGGTYTATTTYAFLNTGTVGDVTNAVFSANYSVVYNETSLNSYYYWYKVFADGADKYTANTDYQRVYTYTRDLEHSGVIGTISGGSITATGAGYTAVQNIGYIEALKNLTISTPTGKASASYPLVLNSEGRIASCDYTLTTEYNGTDAYVTLYEYDYTYGGSENPATINLIENVTFENPKDYTIRNQGYINTIKNSTISAGTLDTIVNETGHYATRKSYRYYSGTTAFSTTKNVAEVTYDYTRVQPYIGLLDGNTITAGGTTYAIRNYGRIGTIKNNTITSTTTGTIYNASCIVTEFHSNVNTLRGVTAVAETSLTNAYDTTENAKVENYIYTPALIDCIGEGNTITGTYNTIYNLGKITSIDSGEGTPSKIIGTARAAVYNVTGTTGTRVRTATLTAANAEASVTVEDTYIPAEIGTIKHTYFQGARNVLVNGDGTATYDPVKITEIGEGAEFYNGAVAYDVVLNASAYAQIVEISGGIFRNNKSGAYYAIKNNSTTYPILLSGGDFRNYTTGSTTGRARAVYNYDVLTTITYAPGKYLSTAKDTRTPPNVVNDNLNTSGYYYLVDVDPVAKIVWADSTKEETNYWSIPEAVAAVENAEDTIVIIKDISGKNKYTIPADKTVTIDLNGHTVAYTTGATEAKDAYNNAAVFTNYGTLTISDSIGGGKITTDACATAANGNTQYVSAIRNESGAHLTVTGGELLTTETLNYFCASILNLEGATVDEISGGTFDPAKGYPVFNNGTITLISGGTLHSTNGHGIHNAGTIVTISGGEFQSDNYSGLNNKGTVTAITGGTFTGGVASNVVWAGFYTRSGSTGTTTVSGGYFKGGGEEPTKADAIKVESGGTTVATIAYAEGTHLSNATYTVNGTDGYYQVVSVYTVTFDVKGHGDAPDPITEIESGLKIPAPQPYTSGLIITENHEDSKTYRLDGWYKDEEFADDWDFATDTVTANTTLYAKWTVTVTFDVQGIGTAPDAMQVADGKKVTAPTAPTAAGYRFDGWYKEAACTNAWNFAEDTVTEATTLYAKWTQVYTVTFDMGNHGTQIDPITNIVPDSKIDAPDPAPTAEHCEFVGWYKEDTFDTPWDFATDTVTADTTLYAKWTVDKYEITWKLDANTLIDTTEVEYDVVPTHTDPTKETTEQYTYTFAGWSTDGTNVIDLPAVTGTAIYIAVFTQTPNVARIGTAYYTTLTDAIDAAAAEDTVTLLANITGQYTIPEGKELTLDLNGKTITNNDSVLINSKNSTLTLELNGGTIDFHYGSTTASSANAGKAAVHNYGTMTVQDTVGGGVITSDAVATDSTSCAKCAAVLRNENNSVLTVKRGKFLQTETVNSAGAGIVNLGKIEEISGGEFKGKTYAVVSSKNATDEFIKVTGGTFTSEGYALYNNNTNYATVVTGGYFKGSTRDTSINKWNEAGYYSFPSGMGLSTVTTTGPNGQDGYYTIVNFWTVSFNVNDHGMAPANQTVENTLKATAPDAPTADGYTFAGWYKEAACEHEWVFGTDTVTANTTLYAKWICGVTFNMQGHGLDTAPAALTGLTPGSTITAPTAPTDDDYIFEGWYKEAACTNEWNFSTDTVTVDTTLYAKWTAKATSISSATVTVSGTYTYTGSAITPDAGAITVVLNGVTLSSGTDYTFEVSNNTDAGTATVTVTGTGGYKDTATGTFTIGPKSVTITGLGASDKTYDGTTDATVTGTAVVSGKVEGDDVTVSAGSASFDNKNVGTGKTVSFTGYRLSGADAGNYNLSAQPADVTASITAKSVTITGLSASDKEYDGNTNATATGTATLEGVLDGDTVSVEAGSANFADKNVGTNKTVTFTGYSLSGADAGNYTLSAQPASVTANITAKSVTITGLSASNKEYDGNADATVTGTATVDGKVEGDTVTVSAGSANFADKNVGTNKTVTFTGYSLSGADAGNYTLSAQPASVTANITSKSVTITGLSASDKEYDGNTNATVTGTATLTGVIDGDTVTVSAGSASFDTKNAGTGKTVTFTGYSLSGADAGNYNLSAQPASVTANITAKSVTITGLSASDKTYDGTTDATVTGTATLTGVIDGDTVTVSAGSASFADKNVGDGKVVTFTNYSLSGADAGNYTLSVQPASVTANITAKSVTITGLSASNKEYDGNANATVTGEATLTGVIDGDTVTVSAGSASYDTKNVGDGKVVTFTNYSLSGADAGNYTLSAQPASVTASITAKSVTITGLSANDKEYDGNTTATVTGTATLTGVIDGDTVTVSAGSASFADKNVGDGKVVTFTNYSLSGADAGNYTLSVQPASVTANITAKSVTITGLSASNKEYDGNADATVTGTAVIDGKVDGDTVTVSAGSASFADKTVGEGKTVSFTGYSLSGADASNYSLSAQPASVTASIAAKSVTITGLSALDKGYDTTVNATVTGTPVLDGVIDGDDVTVVNGYAEFEDAEVGNDKTVTFSGYSLTGEDAGNYELSQPASVTASITASVARIGATYYPSLSAAVAAAEDGDTIYVIADDNVSLTNGQEITIDKSLTISGEVDEDGDPITDEEGSFFTIFGTSNQTGYNDIFITGDGEVTLSYLNIKNFGNNAATDIGHAPIYVSSNFSGTVKLEGLFISDFNRGGVFLYGDACEFNVVDCDINCANSRSGAFTKGIEIKNGASGTISNTWIYNMERSTTAYASAGIEVYGYGDVTVDGCWIMSNEDESHSTTKATYGIVVGAVGAYDPAGGTLTVTDTTTNTTNAALSVDADDYAVELNENSFDNYMVTWDAGSTVTVNSGEYWEDVYADAGTFIIYAGEFKNFLPDTGANGSIVIYGGIFDAEVPEEYCAEHYMPADYDEALGLYTVKRCWYVTFENYDGEELVTVSVLRDPLTAPVYEGDKPTRAADAQYHYSFDGWTDGTTDYGTEDALPDATEDATYTALYTTTPTVAKIERAEDEILYFTTLTDAIGEAGEDETVVLLSDVTGQFTIDVDKSLTLDLNGKTVTGDGGDALTNNGALSIQDTAGGGLIKSESGSAVVNNGSIPAIDCGEFKGAVNGLYNGITGTIGAITNGIFEGGANGLTNTNANNSIPISGGYFKGVDRDSAIANATNTAYYTFPDGAELSTETFTAPNGKSGYYRVVAFYSVTFIVNDDVHVTEPFSIVRTSIPFDSRVSAPTKEELKTVTPAGYAVEGWFANENYAPETEWDFSADTVQNDMTLYAKWARAAETTVHYVLSQSGADSTENTVEITYFPDKILEEPVYTYYSFNGWFWNGKEYQTTALQAALNAALAESTDESLTFEITALFTRNDYTMDLYSWMETDDEKPCDEEIHIEAMLGQSSWMNTPVKFNYAGATYYFHYWLIGLKADIDNIQINDETGLLEGEGFTEFYSARTTYFPLTDLDDQEYIAVAYYRKNVAPEHDVTSLVSLRIVNEAQEKLGDVWRVAVTLEVFGPAGAFTLEDAGICYLYGDGVVDITRFNKTVFENLLTRTKEGKMNGANDTQHINMLDTSKNFYLYAYATYKMKGSEETTTVYYSMKDGKMTTSLSKYDTISYATEPTT